MIGNNFTLQTQSDYNPLLERALVGVEKAALETPSVDVSDLTSASQLLLKELEKLNVPPEHYLFHLAKDFAQCAFYVIANRNIDKQCEDLIAMSDETSELEIEPLDIRRNPESVAWAVQNQAFVTLKQASDDKEIEMKFAPKWADYIAKGKVKGLRVKDEIGLVKTTLACADIKITRFSAAEINYISTIILKAVDIAYQIKDNEQQKKAAEEKRKKDQQEMCHQEQQCREILMRNRLEQNEVSEGFFSTLASEPIHSISTQKMIEKRMNAWQEEVREQERLKERDEQKARNIKSEVDRFELKREILKQDVRSREIKQEYIRPLE